MRFRLISVWLYATLDVAESHKINTQSACPRQWTMISRPLLLLISIALASQGNEACKRYANLFGAESGYVLRKRAGMTVCHCGLRASLPASSRFFSITWRTRKRPWPSPKPFSGPPDRWRGVGKPACRRLSIYLSFSICRSIAIASSAWGFSSINFFNAAIASSNCLRLACIAARLK